MTQFIKMKQVILIVVASVISLSFFLIHEIGIQRERLLLREKAIVHDEIQVKKRFLLTMEERYKKLKMAVPVSIGYENKVNQAGILIFSKLVASDYIKMLFLCDEAGIPIKSVRGIKKEKKLIVEVEL